MEVGLNFFHWFDLHLRGTHGLSVQELNENLGGSTRIWHWTANAAREIFSDRVFQSGY